MLPTRSNTEAFLLLLLVSVTNGSRGEDVALPPPHHPCAADLCVGAAYALQRPSDAARIAMNGQTIFIAGGNYDRDVAVWSQHNLTIRGVDGRPHLRAFGVTAEDKAIWVVRGNNLIVENVEFSGAAVPDANGAAIRLEGTNLTMRRCLVHDNQNGILTGRNPYSDVLIENSEFSGGGRAHNIYIGEIRKFTLRGSYIHHALVGHQVKSRAAHNVIEFNRIMDETDGNSSYAIDLPNGGEALIQGNVIQQGARTENYTLISYGAELKQTFQYPRNALFVINNTLINDLPEPHGTLVFIRAGTPSALVANNVLVGGGAVVKGYAKQIANQSVPKNEFVDPSTFDYHLRAGSRAIDAAQSIKFDLPSAELSQQYAHKASLQPRPHDNKLDLGAYEYVQP